MPRNIVMGEPRATGTTRSRVACAVLLAAVGGIELIALSAFMLDPGVGQVDPSQVAAAVPIGARRPDGQLAVTTLVMVACAVATAEVPHLFRATDQRRLALALNGTVLLLATSVLSMLSRALWFAGEDDGCRDPSCWPLPWQQLAVCTPAVLLGLATIGAAFARRTRWWVVAGPALVWVAAVVAQRLLWAEVLLPLFSGPPP